MGETTGPPLLALMTSNAASTHIYTGSFKNQTTVAEFANGPKGGGPTYATFRKMLEVFLNKLYSTHQIPLENYLRVRSDQMVTSL